MSRRGITRRGFVEGGIGLTVASFGSFAGRRAVAASMEERVVAAG